jgi:hypothetical protein
LAIGAQVAATGFAAIVARSPQQALCSSGLKRITRMGNGLDVKWFGGFSFTSGSASSDGAADSGPGKLFQGYFKAAFAPACKRAAWSIATDAHRATRGNCGKPDCCEPLERVGL